MPLSHPIQLKLEPDKLLRYQDEAAAQKVTLAEYLRRRLDRAEITDELVNLRVVVDSLSRGGGGKASYSSEKAVLLEVLLLLRSTTPPQKQGNAHDIIRGLGLEPLTFGKPHDASARKA